MYFSEWVLYVVEFAEASTNQNPINNKAFLKFQRHNCSMKSISFGFYAQLSVVCMWLSQYIDIYTIYIYILYTSIKCVSLVDPSTSRPQGFGLWDGTERKKQKKSRMDEAAVRAHGALLEGNRSRTCDIIDMKHWKHPCHSPQCNIPLQCGYFWRLKFLDFFWRDVLLLMEEIHLASWYLQSCFMFQPVSRISSINGMDIYRPCNVQCMLLCFPQP